MSAPVPRYTRGLPLAVADTLNAVLAENRLRLTAHHLAALALGGSLDEFQALYPGADPGALMSDPGMACQVELAMADEEFSSRCLAKQNMRELCNVHTALITRSAQSDLTTAATVDIADMRLKIDRALHQRDEAGRDGTGVRLRSLSNLGHRIYVRGPHGQATLAPVKDNPDAILPAVVRALGSVDDKETDAVRAVLHGGPCTQTFPAWP